MAQWEPHKSLSVDGPEKEVAGISEPPCAWCRHWRPTREYATASEGSGFAGVRCCQAAAMLPDFGCFEARPAGPRPAAAPAARSASASAPAPVDGSGYESFLWNGQTRYRCKKTWDNGAPCAYDTYDLLSMHDHERTVHGKKRGIAPPVPTLFDAAGDLIEREQFESARVPGEPEFKFAPER